MHDLSGCPRVTAPCEALSERDRADVAEVKLKAAEGRLAEIHRTVVEGFLAEYGTSTLPAFAVAAGLARSVRKILTGKGLAAGERIAEDERERLLAELAGRKVTLAQPGFGRGAAESVDAVPWPVLEDILRGLPTAGCEEVRGG